MSWQKHFIKQGDSYGGWIPRDAKYQLLHQSEGKTIPFGIAQMDNGNVLLLCSWEFPDPNDPNITKQTAVFTVSTNRGESWDTFCETGGSGRSIMLSYLGKDKIAWYDARGRVIYDYGKKLQEVIKDPPWLGCFEGNPLIDRDSQGKATMIAEVGCPEGSCYDSEIEKKVGECQNRLNFGLSAGGKIRWSNDEGRTWTREVTPDAWSRTEEYQGDLYPRRISEGSLVRAKNRWIVAALRTDPPMRFVYHRHCDSSIDKNKCYDDSLCGLGVSISKDDGNTWSPIHMLYDAGRHHPHLLQLPNGDLVMTIIVRADVPYGSFALGSPRRGCEAIISRDNGLTWDLTHKYILDEFGYHNDGQWFDGQCGHLSSTLLDDGSILTCYGNYQKGAVLINWKPNED
jgi:hypothetical protein